jgi:hypothetical protein
VPLSTLPLYSNRVSKTYRRRKYQLDTEYGTHILHKLYCLIEGALFEKINKIQTDVDKIHVAVKLFNAKLDVGLDDL